MRVQELLPVEARDQRSLSDAWERVVRDGAGTLRREPQVRTAVKASWERSLHRGILPTLPRAPMQLDDASLAELREQVDWLPHAELAVRAHASGSVLDGHILALFDDRARMLVATGDPRALDGLADINFRPGALWSEDAVGTNGPGTALALARAVHIVGAEHFCERWQGWHCAAAPIRDPLTQDVLGVLDLSGFREKAHPHTLSLATAIAVALEQRLAAREAERRVTLLRQFGSLVGRYPTDAILVVDRAGEIIASSTAAERIVRRLQASGHEATDVLRAMSTNDGHTAGANWQAPSHTIIRDASHPMLGATAAVHAMHDGRTPIGACVVLPLTSGARDARVHTTVPGHAGARTAVSTATTAPARGSDGAVQRGAVTGVSDPGRDTIARSSSRSPSRAGSPRPAGTHMVRYTLDALRGAAPVLEEVRRFARACARTDLPVLLLGESGTGKEVIAQGIHAASPRAHAPFVAVNCAALPRELVESELFGHVAGAFSGARRDGAIGKFEAADGGTLFLDEIGELPPAAQAALLRVLQEGEITRLGATSGRHVDVRIIAATNRDIASAIASGQLRDDLYHRLNVLTHSLPPLRARTGDAVLLARHFLGTVSGTLAQEFSPAVLHAFEHYRWPGNVRELENLVKRVAALSETAMITEDLLPAALRDVAARAPAKHFEVGFQTTTAIDDLVADLPAGDALREQLRTRYASLIASHATMRDAAKAIGVTRSTLYRRLQRIGLAPGRGVRDTA
ncbi:Fis family transcriptional regulator [Gemmatimonas aurantiaca T-27]|uniref:Fis family transcriptional regulator n=1 Tax=Gemmatimonas aurantiaca (strain DSM 14586 / JCM 11422 / NBRC 100505 / T-27) TaxID=379066 RepID=C1A3Y4_GEMAT|nr:sigma 54-interacting transcriptional regulator [Gemmatimonas aurantiaca]BAH38809.1 Fis family transcriptional regulator [Gemmatimonas aurantiaca T-27]